MRAQPTLVRPIRTEEDYETVLAEVASLMDAEPDTAEGDRLDVLTTLLEAYEARRWAIDLPDPIDAIKARMAQRGLRPRDLEPILGGRGRVSEVLNRKRPLTLAMIRRLEHELGIDAAILIRQPAEPRRRPARRTRQLKGADAKRR